jgi:hypothetical protein
LQSLFKAAAGGDAEKLQTLLGGSADLDLNKRYEKEANKTLLHVVRGSIACDWCSRLIQIFQAAESGHTVVVGLLLERGADYTVIDSGRCTAMDLAVNNSHAECGYMLAKTLMSAAEWQSNQLAKAREKAQRAEEKVIRELF